MSGKNSDGQFTGLQTSRTVWDVVSTLQSSSATAINGIFKSTQMANMKLVLSPSILLAPVHATTLPCWQRLTFFSALERKDFGADHLKKSTCNAAILRIQDTSRLDSHISRYVHHYLTATKVFKQDGSLVFEVEIRVRQNTIRNKAQVATIWKPSNSLSVDMLKMLDSADADNSDVSFEVGKGRKTKMKNGKELFHAHSLILKSRAPLLASLTEDMEEGTPIPIEDMEPYIFRKVLRFIYGGEVPPEDVLKSEARTIIRAADRFGVTGLKLSAEAELASAGIDVNNCAGLILLADGTSCAMLKEAAIDYFVANSAYVLASDGYGMIEQSPSITKELMLAMAVGSKKCPAKDINGEDIKRMRVSTLRQKLEEKGLDVDGLKEMLVARLLENEAADG